MTDRHHRAPAPSPVAPDELTWRCDPGSFDFDDTSKLEASRDIIGQDRALRAIGLGLEMKSPGYNIFLAGFVGTGRNTTVQRVLQKLDRGTEAPDDLCYVYNFEDPDRPRAVFLPAGKGQRLARRMRVLVARLRREIPQVFESDAYRQRRDRLRERFQKRQREIIEGFDERAKTEGLTLVQIQVGAAVAPDVVPLVDGEPKSFADLEEAVEAGKFDAAKLEELREKHRAFASELQSVVKGAMKIEAEMTQHMAELDRDQIRPVVKAAVDMVRDELADVSDVAAYLDHVEEHALGHADRFTVTPAEAPPGTPEENGLECPVEYQVNLVVDNRATEGAPVVLESSPTAAKLFGILERTWSSDGEEPVDHMRIKGGSLLEANGGYLVLNAADLFSEPPYVWHALKRTLRTGRLEIHASEPGSMLGPPALKPEPVQVSVKVVLIGDSHLYALLYAYDDDFKKIFKVRADFDTEMENTPENVNLYGSFIQRLVEEEKVLAFDRTGLARTAEYGSRLTGRKDKLSTRFNMIADLVREASYFAGKEGASLVGGAHLDRALEEKIYRNNLAEEKMQEAIDDGAIFIDVEGTAVGAVNGLAVYESGEHLFGLPSKITATVSMGNAGIINIEREAELSGRTHDKGVQILSGYLRSKYAQEKPLTLSASICFEQSYGGVDGDSASSTELYAILSALAEIPLRQDIAVTGSVNQQGDVQPIGGVNEKIEGFFDVCRARGLSGTQGVLIPAANLTDLVLHRRIVEAVEAGQFAVWAVATIDEGIEILTGVKAGERAGRRAFPRGTVNAAVELRLKRLATQMREFQS